jgi:hypothetical protein
LQVLTVLLRTLPDLIEQLREGRGQWVFLIVSLDDSCLRGTFIARSQIRDRSLHLSSFWLRKWGKWFIQRIVVGNQHFLWGRRNITILQHHIVIFVLCLRWLLLVLPV